MWCVCASSASAPGARVQDRLSEQDEVPEDLEVLEDILSETYFCNFSVFQSLPDTWAIGQLFPIMPIHRLDEEPLRRGDAVEVVAVGSSLNIEVRAYHDAGMLEVKLDDDGWETLDLAESRAWALADHQLAVISPNSLDRRLASLPRVSLAF